MRKILENGFLEIEDCPLAKSGIFMYHSSELGMEGDKMVSVRIPPEVLGQTQFDFDLPITLGHTWLGLNAKKNKRAEIIGQATSAHQDFDMIRGRVVLYDKDVIKGIMDGSMVDELSPAFRFRIVEDEEKIADFVATEVYAPNHIALVSKGRMGKDVRVIHEAIQKEMEQESDIAEEKQEQQPEADILPKDPEPQADQKEEKTDDEPDKENNSDVSDEKKPEESGNKDGSDVRPVESVEPDRAEENKEGEGQKPETEIPEEKAEEKPAEEPKQEEVKEIPPEETKAEEKKEEEPAKPSVKNFSYHGVMYSVIGSNGKPPLPRYENSAKIRY